jgi:hypothetical protein
MPTDPRRGGGREGGASDVPVAVGEFDDSRRLVQLHLEVEGHRQDLAVGRRRRPWAHVRPLDDANPVRGDADGSPRAFPHSRRPPGGRVRTAPTVRAWAVDDAKLYVVPTPATLEISPNRSWTRPSRSSNLRPRPCRRTGSRSRSERCCRTCRRSLRRTRARYRRRSARTGPGLLVENAYVAVCCAESAATSADAASNERPRERSFMVILSCFRTR